MADCIELVKPKATPVAKRTRARPQETEPQAEAQPSPGGFASGRHLVQDHDCLAWPHADRGDVLDIDFDVREYRGEGFYLLQHSAPADEVSGAAGCFPFSTAYLGVRLIRKGAPGQMQMNQVASVEAPGMRNVPADEWERTTVLGQVKNIYRRHVPGCADGLFLVGQLVTVGDSEDGSACLQFRHKEGRTINVSGLTTDEARRLAPHFMKTMRLEVKP